MKRGISTQNIINLDFESLAAESYRNYRALYNFVYMELLSRGYVVHVGKAGENEVDFIAEKPEERIYIQVSYLLATEDVVEREFRSPKSIQDNYRKIVLSLDRLPLADKEGIEWMNLIDFLLE